MRKLKLEEFKNVFDILRESCIEKPYFNEIYYSENHIGIEQIVYENQLLNEFSNEDWVKYIAEYEEETGCSYTGDSIDSNFNAHLSICTSSNDNYIHICTLEVGVKHKGFGNRILEAIEQYADDNEYDGVLLRYTINEHMNTLAIKRNYKPIYTTIQERINFANKENCVCKDTEIKYDSNLNPYGYYLLKF